MAENVEIFDLPRREFVDQVRAWSLPNSYAAHETPSMGELRSAIGALAGVLWILGQRVKKLEEKE